MDTKDAISVAEDWLQAAGVENWQGEAKIITAHVLNCRVNELGLTNRVFNNKMQSELLQILRQRSYLYPLQYVLGEQEFMGLDFKVTPATLIPRGDTERIVEEAIELMKDAARPVIVDVCCGSGAIAVSLARFLPNARLVAMDISFDACQIAKENAARHNVSRQIRFLTGDLLVPLFAAGVLIDMIVCNPPYIKSSEIQNLPIEVQSEPRMALDGGSDGLLFYRRLAIDAPMLLKDGGYLLVETGCEQKDAVCQILENKSFKIVKTINDYGGNHRGILARWQG
ncbi:MAG: peptide chain release factor N(5)-glutamine methyltransferase [Clostridia bacterium]|nr:peptide chain release factor N(5)-glutamine methyltransferase [Clostridia bacterium]MDD4797952.1 peptide chain release factor N(5)-glutamine methyltransferase [Clostridia bacterium]